jgi:dienelactone hydrolase
MRMTTAMVCAFALLAGALLLGVLQAGDSAGGPPDTPAAGTPPVMWDMARLSAAPATWDAEGFSADGVRALYFQGEPYHGAPTRVFAWLGLPAVPPGTTVPAMVLVHGGGGTAFASWVRRWTARGYAAIAMDCCGALPRKAVIDGKEGKEWERNPAGGPRGWGGFDQIDAPRTDQWTYHAVAAAILAHSLLRAQPGVDSGRIGLTGISWGGYLTCLIASNDARFRFAVPVYGCGFTNEHTFAPSVLSLGEERARRWMQWWDPSSYLAQAAMPLCWITGSNDFAYTFNALQKSYRLPPGARTLAIRLRMPHGHGDAGEAPPEVFAFADSMLRDGEALVRISGQGRSGAAAWASYACAHPLAKAELNWTVDHGPWPARLWQAAPADISVAGKVTASVPAGATVYYLNLFDQRGCVVSSEHEELAPPATP